MTHSPALTLARAQLSLDQSEFGAYHYVECPADQAPPGLCDCFAGTVHARRAEALAAIDSELAASANTGNLPEIEAKLLVEMFESAVLAKATGGGDRLGFARVDLLAALSRPAPAERHLTLTKRPDGELVMVSWQDDEHRILEVAWKKTAPVSAQGDERAALRESLQPFLTALEVNDGDTLSGMDSDKTVLFTMTGSWSHDAPVTLGDLRKLAKAARAQVAQGDEVDAARYQWLRSRKTWASSESPNEGTTLILHFDTYATLPEGDDAAEWFDGIVDAARAQQGDAQ